MNIEQYEILHYEENGHDIYQEWLDSLLDVRGRSAVLIQGGGENMIVSAISHEEATIQSFMRDPEFADYFLKDVIADGDINEIRRVKGWIDEARARAAGMEFATAAG